jgi:pyridoxamine 5'-phosphate oxidase family protein
MAFTDEELEYLRSEPLARLATVAPGGEPDVTPVALEVETTTLCVCGAGDAVLGTRKVRNITAGNRRVALVVDDLPSFEPFVAPGIRIYGTADDPIERRPDPTTHPTRNVPDSSSEAL